MARPRCKLHPAGRVRRDGYYGKHKEFVRWECVPANGDAPHYLNHTQLADLRPKLIGGVQHGSCDSCERVWEPTDGLASADYDKFVLREKATLLVLVAQGGLSMREAAWEARAQTYERRHGRRPRRVRLSRDGRMARDWVSPYTPIIAEHYLPTSWPEAIAVDTFDVRVPAFKPDGTPKQKGKHLYSVFAAVGYEQGSWQGELWSVAAYPGESELYAREFFDRLTGRPSLIVCDGSWAIRNAAAHCFPKAQVYPCTWHLYNGLKEHVRKAGLWSNRRMICRVVREDMFRYPARYGHFEQVFSRYRNADLSKAPAKTQKGIEDIIKWRRRNREQINLVLPSTHRPRDLQQLEEHLDTIQRRLGDRRRMFRNLHRLNCVLDLMAIQIRGEASVTSWARILRENHRDYEGHPPPRRIYDGKVLTP